MRAPTGMVVSKVPVHRLTDALDRLLALYKDKRESAEEPLGAFFRRVPPALATTIRSDAASASNKQHDHDSSKLRKK